jgi:two-component system capsular synthesis sensor histidine kinase RcsC
MILVDPTRFRQVVTNLVSNAVKFTDRGRAVLRARHSSAGGGRVVVTVHDTGGGIPADKHGRLFQPFSQVDSSLTRRAGGTGLGLVICHRLALAFGGTLRVRSRVGHGSTFRLSLPLAPERAAEAA